MIIIAGGTGRCRVLGVRCRVLGVRQKANPKPDARPTHPCPSQSPILNPPSTDIAIIGAGPQALTLGIHLLQKKAAMRNRFVGIDPAGEWLHQRHHQFAALEIPHLRSPAVHHLDPHPAALHTFVEGRPDQLFPPYARPSTPRFRDFCQSVTQRWNLSDRVLAGTVQHLELCWNVGRQRFRLSFADSRQLLARRVVLAIVDGTPPGQTGHGEFPRPIPAMVKDRPLAIALSPP